MTDVLVVLVTVPREESLEPVALRLARTLVTEKLAACVNRIPGVQSIYTWEGKVQDDAEEILVIKTSRTRLEDLSRRIQELHPYDVPEIIALPVDSGLPDYLNWVLDECASD